MSKKYIVIVLIVVVVLFVALIAGAITAKKHQKAVEQPPTTVTTVDLTTGPIEEVIAFTGSLEGRDQATVVSQTSGVVKKLRFAVGDRCQNGDVLVEVESSQQEAGVAQAEAQLLAAKTNHEKAARDLTRVQKLYQENVTSEDNLELAQLNEKSAYAQMLGADAALKVAKKQLSDTRIAATISGHVGNRMVNLGQTLSPGSPIVTIVDDSEYLLKVNVPEKNIMQVKSGQTVQVKVDAMAGTELTGRVKSVGLAFVQDGTAYPVEIAVKAESGLRAGMFARCIVSTAKKDAATLVPSIAILRIDNKPYVYVAENGKAVLKSVETGLQSDVSVEILSGLNPGDKIITVGKDQVTDGARIQ
jgi:RND family efflux transporter MFP subunit